MSSAKSPPPISRPVIPPKPDKEKTSLKLHGTGDSSPAAGSLSQPNSPEIQQSSTTNGEASSSNNSEQVSSIKSPPPGPHPSSKGVSKSHSSSAVLTSSSFTFQEHQRSQPSPNPKPLLQKPPISPAKPALPPKPSGAVISPPKKSLSTPPQSSPFQIAHNTTTTSSPPIVPTGRNSLSIANSILANKGRLSLSPHSSSNASKSEGPSSLPIQSKAVSSGNVEKVCEDSFSDPETSARVVRREKSEGFSSPPPANRTPPNSFNPFKTPSKFLSSEPSVGASRPQSFSSVSSSRPTSSVFNFPPFPEPTDKSSSGPSSQPTSFTRRLELKGKSASLGRNVAPPPSTSLTAGISGFFSNKAVTLSRILPLDLQHHFGKSSPKERPSTLPPFINFHSSQSQMNSPKSPIESFGRKISFSTGSATPPPPPPRQRKNKLSPVSSLSPVESLSPTSPVGVSSPSSLPPNSSMSPVCEESSAIYAEIDKEKKWADRRLKEEAINNLRDPTTGDPPPEGIQASLVINLNRNVDNKVESVSVDGQSQTFVVEPTSLTISPPDPDPPLQTLSNNANQPSSSVKQLSSHFESQSNSSSANRKLSSDEPLVIDSWLAKYITPTANNNTTPQNNNNTSSCTSPTQTSQPKDSLSNICETMKSIVLTDLSRITNAGNQQATDTNDMSLNTESEAETNDEEPQSITLTLGPPTTSADIHFVSSSITSKKDEVACKLTQNDSFLFSHLKPQSTETTETTVEASQVSSATVKEDDVIISQIQSSVTIVDDSETASVNSSQVNTHNHQVKSNANEMPSAQPQHNESEAENNQHSNDDPTTSLAPPPVPEQDVLLHLVGANIQSVVTHLSNLSGNNVTNMIGQIESNSSSTAAAGSYIHPQNDDLTSQPFELSLFNEALVPLSITEYSDALANINNNKLEQIQQPHDSHNLLLPKDSSLSNNNHDPNNLLGEEVKSSASYSALPTVIEDTTDSTSNNPFPRRRSWNCSGDSSSPCESSSSSLNNIREKTFGCQMKWVDDGNISTGALADTENSDIQVPSSSTEDIGASGSLSRRKRGWIFRSFGKAGSSSSSSSTNGTPKTSQKGRHKDKIKSLFADSSINNPSNRTTSLTTGRLGRQISDSVLGASLISNPLVVSSPQTTEEIPKESNMPSKDCHKSHPTVQFSPDVVETPVYRYRYSESSVSDAGEVLGSSMCPGEGDNESVSSAESSVGGITAGSYVVNVPEYEDILNELTSKNERKAFYVAREILTSEKNFLNVLDLLTIDFPNWIKKVEKELKHPIIPPYELDGILASLPNLKLVNEELKVDLENRIKNWRENPKLADVIVKKGPFLKLYAHYIKNFEKTTQILDACCHRYAAFQKAVSDFEASDRCQKLGLKHYMLKPVQRMPQYRLLLEDYMKAQEPDSGDYNDTLKALAIVKDVAEHANEAIRLQVNAEKLMHLQNRLAGSVIMKADRQLMKEGELRKVCRKGLQPRYFALMNDCLLCMNYNVGTGAVKDLKLRYELPLTGMKVSLTATEDYPNEFSVISIARSFNLVATSAREREDWMKALNDCINDNIKKRACSTPDKELGFQLGKIAPVWIQDSRVTMCQICTAEFTVTFRRHHCRACGKVVCGHCSGNSAPLQYLKNDAARVCDECYQHLLDEFDKETMDNTSAEGLETSRETIRNRFKKVTPTVSKRATHVKRIVPARLEVHANNSGAKVSSYLYYRKRKAWKRNWFVLIDRVLYVYAASEDIVATRTIPVLGWTVASENIEYMDGGDNEAVFKLMHSGQNTLLFQAENPSLAERWIEALKEATVLT